MSYWHSHTRYAAMSHSISVNSSTGSGVTSHRRRRLATWMLLGWAMFWLVTVIQPCCSSFAVPQANADQRMAIPIGNDAMWLANWHRGAPLEEGSCQSVSAILITPPSIASAGAYRLDLSPAITLAASAVPAPRHAGVIIAHAPSASPLSGAPAYLRHQRLLI